MPSPRERWQTLGNRFMAFGRRERLMMALALAMVILLGGWQLLVTPYLAQKKAVDNRISSLSEDIQASEEQRRTLEREVAQDPNEPLRKRRTQLNQRLERYSNELDELTTGLISPTEMVALLKQMLAEHEGISLVSVSHQPAEPVALEESSDGDGRSGLFSHPVSVTVEGSFHELLDYLDDLEALDERLGWRSMDYQVGDWPEARVQIRLHTLSLHEEWLGV